MLVVVLDVVLVLVVLIVVRITVLVVVLVVVLVLVAEVAVGEGLENDDSEVITGESMREKINVI